MMLRVAHYDALQLKEDLLVWFHSQLKTQNAELLLLFDILFFNASNRQVADGVRNSFLELTSSSVYTTNKKLLFVLDVLVKYVIKKLDVRAGAIKVYNVVDFVNFILYLNGKASISPLYTLFNVHVTPIRNVTTQFYQDFMLGNILLHNRQLLWNAALELFNMTLLNTWVNTKLRKLVISKQKVVKSPNCCAKCGLFPTNPYQLQCCNSLNCYVCVLDTLDLKICNVCNSSSIKAIPYY